MLSRFVSRSSDKCQPFFQVLKKAFHWDVHCEEAFAALKTYLSSPSILVSPFKGKLLTLYLAVFDFSTSATLVRERDRAQQPIYYYSRALRGGRGKVSKDGEAISSIGDHRQKTSTILLSSHHRDFDKTHNEANIA